YDPLSGDKEHNAIVEYDSSSDNEVIDEEVLGKEVALDQDEYEKEESKDICLPEQGEETLDSDKLPPMPAGTPPLLPEDMCCDDVWPVLPVANEETEDVGVGVGVVVGTGAESSILTLICHDQHILRQ
ncbi:hypothetical protein GGH99_005832, partial [Coemansia sp. RSA 1285]